MYVDRVFYLTQQSLSVYVMSNGIPMKRREFEDSASGFVAFDRYLSEDAVSSVAILTDLIEEEFANDTIPKLSRRDRAMLLKRRAAKKFRRTQFRLSLFQGESEFEDGEFDALHCAISNAELLESWLFRIERHQIALRGIHSVSLVAEQLIDENVTAAGPVLFVAPHQSDKIRQVFVRNGKLRSARLSKTEKDVPNAYETGVAKEAERSRRYLERSRLINSQETLEVYFVGSQEQLASVERRNTSGARVRFHALMHEELAPKMNWGSQHSRQNFEIVHIHQIFKKRQCGSYASARDTRYWRLSRLRFGYVTTASFAAVACSVVASVLLADAWLLDRKFSVINQQIEQLSASYRFENESFIPIKANSHEMKLAVDTGDYILSNRVPVPWVFNQLGAIMGDYPDVQLSDIRWTADSGSSTSVETPRRGNRAMPIAIETSDTVNIMLKAEFSTFDGNLRRAFQEIDAFAADIQSRTSFTDVAAVQYPFEADTTAAVSGEVDADRGMTSVRFELKLRYVVPRVEKIGGGATDDSA